MRTELRRVSVDRVSCWSDDPGVVDRYILARDELLVVLEETHSPTGARIVRILSPRCGRCWMYADSFQLCTEAAGSRAAQ
jgi:hypothetical protein